MMLFVAMLLVCEVVLICVASRTLNRIVWRLELDHDRIVVHRLFASEVRGWSDVKRIYLGNHVVSVPIFILPISVSTSAYRTINFQLNDDSTLSVLATNRIIEEVNYLERNHLRKDVDYLVDYREALDMMHLSGVVAAYWCHLGDVPAATATKEQLVEAIMEYVRARHDDSAEREVESI